MTSAGTGPAPDLDDELDTGWAQVDSSPEDIISGSDTRSDGSTGASPSERAQPPGMEPQPPASGSGPPSSGGGDEAEPNETSLDDGPLEDQKAPTQPSPTGQELSHAEASMSAPVAPADLPADEDSGRSQAMSYPSPIAIAVDMGSPAAAPMPPPPGAESLESMGPMSREHVEPTDEPIVESPRAVNWTWGLGALSGALKEVSAGVARDVKELKESFQAAIQVSDSDEEGDLSNDPLPQSPHGEPSPPPQMIDGELQRLTVLSKLGQLEGEDTELTKGFKTLDDQVEQLATGLWGFMGQAGQGVGSLARKVEAATKGVAAEVASEFKETLQDVKGLHMAQVATSGFAAAATTGKRLVATAEKGLVNVASILDAGLAEEDLDQYGSLGDEPTFDECFYAARGQAALEETEELGNECSRLCNRSRRSLPEAKRRELDDLLSEFAPLFDLDAELVKPSEGGKGAVPKSDGYDKIERLRSKAVDNAFELSSAAAGLERPPVVVAGLEQKGRGIAQAAEEGLAVLANIRSEGTRSLAALSSAGVNHLLELGNSMGAPLFGTKPDYLWPQGPKDKATLLRFAAQQVEEDARAVASAFERSLVEADEALMSSVRAAEAAAEGREVPGQTEKPVHAVLLGNDLELAVQKIRQAFRALMYVVLATTIPDSSTTGQEGAAPVDVEPGPPGQEDNDDEEDLDWADDAADLDEDDEEEEDDDGAEEDA